MEQYKAEIGMISHNDLYYSLEIKELLPQYKHIFYYGGKEADGMRQKELVFRFHTIIHLKTG